MYCPVCESKNISNLFISQDINYCYGSKKFKIKKCDNCGLTFIWPIPTIQEISNFYHSDYNPYSDIDITKNSGFMKEKLIKKRNELYGEKLRIDNFVYYPLKNLFGNPHIDILKKEFKNKRIKVLDIGCGAGNFLLRLGNHLNIESHLGCDFSETAVQIGRKNDVNIIKGTVEDIETENKYDLIILKHVLEHINNPYVFINQVKKLLSKDGVLFIALPNNHSLGRYIFKKFWVGFDVPRHIYSYNSNSLKILLKKSNLDIKEIYFNKIFLSSINPFFGNLRHDSSIAKKIYSNIVITKLIRFINPILNKFKLGDEMIVLAKKTF